MQFRSETSFHSNNDDKYITNFAYKIFLDPNLFLILSPMKTLKSMQIQII